MSSSFSNRLIAARKMAGLSLQGLEDRLEGMVSRQALHRYEQDQSLPNSQTLIALSRALQVPVDFFFAEPEVHVELSGIDFRKRKALSPAAETAIKAQCTDLLGRYLSLEKLTGQEKPVHPFVHPHTIHTIQDAEQAAEKLRTEWGLGQGPIPNVVAMMEENGYKVIESPPTKNLMV